MSQKLNVANYMLYVTIDTYPKKHLIVLFFGTLKWLKFVCRGFLNFLKILILPLTSGIKELKWN